MLADWNQPDRTDGTLSGMQAIVFPGQGSQRPGMGFPLADDSAAARQVFEEVSAASGRDLRSLCRDADEDTLRQTANAQLALYTVSVAAWQAFRTELSPVAAAGHSVGEFAALAAAGVISVADGARLVQARGDLMRAAGESNPGTMAAVLGMDATAIQNVLATVDGVVVVANDNSPGQIVISGEVAAVQRASEALAAAGAKRVIPLNVSGAFHSPLMESASAQFRAVLDSVSFGPGTLPVYANVLAAPNTDPSAWPSLLQSQLRSAVRWTETVQAMIARGVTEFVELGVGEVLGGLIRRTDKSVATRSLG